MSAFRQTLGLLVVGHWCKCMHTVSPFASQVWVRQTVVENDLNLFKELPSHLQARVGWRSNQAVITKQLNSTQT